jgi:hypothetical protein
MKPAKFRQIFMKRAIRSRRSLTIDQSVPGAIRPGKSGFDWPQSPNVMGHALEHESDIAKPLGLARVPGPCGGKNDNISPGSGSELMHSGVANS